MTTDDPAVPYGYPRSLRTPRVYHAMLWRALLSTPAELARYAITIRGAEKLRRLGLMPQSQLELVFGSNLTAQSGEEDIQTLKK